MAEQQIRGITTAEANEATPLARKILVDIGLDNHPEREALRQRLLNAIVAVRRAASSMQLSKRAP